MVEEVERVVETAKRAAGEAAPWVERLARAGYAARGVVYLLVAWLAARAAWLHRRPGGTDDALSTVDHLPAGRGLLVALAVGLAGFALWRLVQAALDPEHDGNDLRGIGIRLSHAGSGIVHAGLALGAAKLALRWGQPGGTAWYATALTGRGRTIVLLAALGTVGYGIYQLVKAVRKDVEEKLERSEMSERTRRWAVPAARAGIGARGAVFLAAGLVLLRAARDGAEARAPGLEGSLRALQEQPWGAALLGLVAVGLAGYGAFELVKARYRRIRPA